MLERLQRGTGASRRVEERGSVGIYGDHGGIVLGTRSPIPA